MEGHHGHFLKLNIESEYMSFFFTKIEMAYSKKKTDSDFLGKHSFKKIRNFMKKFHKTATVFLVHMDF